MKTVQDVMARGVEVLPPQATLREAAEMMRQFNVGPVPVCEGDKLVGMVTDRDIVVRGIAMGHDPSTSRISSVMTEDVEVIHPHASLTEAAARMSASQFHRLPVVDDDWKVIGIVSQADLAREAGETTASRTLEQISKPSQPAY